MTDSKPTRWTSLDALRGFTIAGMILVNNPGDWAHTWSLLKHADWDGLTIADFVFPFFLFIMGVSQALSIAGMEAKGPLNKQLILKKTAIRSLKLILIGIGLGLVWNHYLDSFRIPGVLQRIGLVNLAVVTAWLYFKPAQWLIYGVVSAVASVLLLHWPNQPAEGNFYAMIDGLVFGPHVYGATKPLDPEGLLSTFNAISSGLMGLYLGRVYSKQGDNGLFNLVPIALLLLVVSIVMHLTGLSPYNKTIWSASFTLVMGGLAVLILAGFRAIENSHPGHWSIRLLRPVGFNPIAIYVLAELSEHLWRIRIGEFRLVKHFNNLLTTVSPFPYFNSFVWSVLLVSLFTYISHLMAKRGLIIKV